VRHPISTAPKDGEFVIIVDDTSGRFDVAQWSTSQEWVRANGEPSKITPSHWNPIDAGAFARPPAQGGPPRQDPAPPEPCEPLALQHPEKAPGALIFAELPFTFGATPAPETAPPTPEDPLVSITPVEEPVLAVDPPPRSSRRWRFAASCAVALIVAAAVGLYWRSSMAAWPISNGSTFHVVEGQVQLAAQALRNLGQWVQRPSPAALDHTTRPDGAGDVRQAHAEAEDTSGTSARRLAETNKRLEILLGELAEARRTNGELDAQLRTQTARAQSLEQERDKASALAEQAGANRQDLAASAERSRNALEAEQARVAALTSELAGVRRDLETKAAAANKANEDVRQATRTAEATTSELRQTLHDERNRSAELARDLEAARREIESRTRAERLAKSQAVAAAPTGGLTTGEPTEAKGTPEAAKLVARASALLAQGDIGAARIVLESAVEAGSARASFALAETYDPNILARWGTYGTRADASKARELYAKATAGGIREAKDRINALRQ
jgi:hypothetical protein